MAFSGSRQPIADIASTTEQDLIVANLEVKNSTNLAGVLSVNAEGVILGGNNDLQRIKTKSIALEESFDHGSHDKKTANQKYTEINTSDNAQCTTTNKVESSNHISQFATLHRSGGEIVKKTDCKSYDYTDDSKMVKRVMSRDESTLNYTCRNREVNKTRDTLTKSGTVLQTANIKKDAVDLHLEKHAKNVNSVKFADRVTTKKLRKFVTTHGECDDFVSFKKTGSRAFTSEINNNCYSVSRNTIAANIEIANGMSKDVAIGEAAKVEILRANNNNIGKALTAESAFSLTKVDGVAMYKQIGEKVYQFMAEEEEAKWKRVYDDKLLKAYLADAKANLRK